MTQTLNDVLKSHPPVEYTAQVFLFPKELFTRKDLASVWLPNKIVKEADAEGPYLLIEGKPVGMIHRQMFDKLWERIAINHKKDGDTEKVISTDFIFSKLSQRICKAFGYKRIRIFPSRKPWVRELYITTDSQDENEHKDKIEVFRNLLRTKFPSVEYVVFCTKTGPCERKPKGVKA